MKKFLCILIFLSALLCADSYGQIYTYTNATNGAPSFTAANTTFTSLTAIGTSTNTPCTQGFSGITGFTNASYSTSGPVVSVTVKPNACYQLNISGFQVGLRRSGTGPASARLIYSVDGGASWVLCPTIFAPLNTGCATSAAGTANCAWTVPLTVTSSTLGVIFRICPYGATNSGGTLQIWGLNINGNVTPCSATLTPTITNVSCNGGTNGAINLGVTNGCNPFTYAWTGPGSYTASTQNISGLSAGTYSVTVSSPGGCSSSTTATVTQPGPINVTVINNGPLCTGANLSLQSSPIAGATYAWVGPNSFSANTQNASVNNVTMAAAGTYTVTATVAGCSGSNNTTVVINPSPAPVLGTVVNPTSCGGTDGSITFTGLAPISVFTLAYTKNGNPQSTTVASDISGNVLVSNLGAGIYNNVIFTLGPCSSTALGPVTLSDPPLPATPIVNSNSPVCSGDAINLSTATVASATYNWTGPNTFSSNLEDPTINPATAANAGTYSLTVTANNCVSLPGIVNVVVKPTPTIANTQFTNPTTCSGTDGTISLTGLTANTTYNVDYSFNTIPQATSITSSNTGVVIISNLSAGTYSNISVDLNGCVSNVVGPVTLTDPTPPVIAGSIFTNPTTCAGADGSISLTGLANNTVYTLYYEFNSVLQGPISLTANGSGVVTLTGLSAGSYTNLNVTLNNCVSNTINSVVLTDPAAPVIAASPFTNPTTCMGSDGSVSLTGLANNTTYLLNYDFNTTPQAAANFTTNNSGVLTITGLASGTYDNIFVTLNNCISNAVGPVTLTDPPLPAVVAGTNAPICEGNTLNLTATNVPGGQYSWTGPNSYTSNAQNPTINNGQISHSGEYIVKVTLNNCVSEPDTIDVLVAPMPTMPVISNNGPLCAGNDLNLFANTIIGATYNWTGPNSFSSSDEDPVVLAVDVTASGTYQVTAQIGTCISGAATTTVLVNPGTPAPVIANVTYCQFESAIALTATGQNLLWYTASSGGAGNTIAPTPSTAADGTFSWYVSQSQNNCESPRAQIDVLVNPKPTMPISDSVIGYCQGVTATSLTATGQNIQWYSASTGGTATTVAPTPQTTVPGIFKYYVTQMINGCESERKEIKVTINTKPAPPVTHNVAYCSGDIAVALFATGSNILWYATASATTGTPTPPLPTTVAADSVMWFATQTVDGCESDKTALTVLVHQQPSVVLYASKYAFCQFETIQFSSTLVTVPQAQYEWTIPSSAEIVSGGTSGTAGISFDQPGSFNVSLLVDNRGCTAADTVSVTVKESPAATISLPEDACMGEEVTVGLGYISSGVNQYDWNFNGASVTESRSNAGPFKVKWSFPGVYIVRLTVSDSVCSSDRNADTIEVHYLPDAAIKPIREGAICVEDSVKVEAFVKEASWEYTWGPAAFFEKENFGSVQYPMVKATSNIYLTVKTPYGCTATDSIHIETQPCCGVYFPTAFSPNGDGRNDVFRPVTDGNHDLAVFVVMNRWGQVVFETINFREVWDGTHNGTPLDIGVYYYYYKYKCEGKMRELKGEVTLVK